MRHDLKRGCDGCTLCCELPSVEAIEKPQHTMCRYCNGTGCDIYATKPEACTNFYCLWLFQTDWPDYLEPRKCGLVMTMQEDEAGPQYVAFTIWANKKGLANYNREPYKSVIKKLYIKVRDRLKWGKFIILRLHTSKGTFVYDEITDNWVKIADIGDKETTPFALGYPYGLPILFDPEEVKKLNVRIDEVNSALKEIFERKGI